jgi:hypothetical protein
MYRRFAAAHRCQVVLFPRCGYVNKFQDLGVGERRIALFIQYAVSTQFFVAEVGHLDVYEQGF